MILSGGLGSSEYVRDAIGARFTNNPHPSAIGVAVVDCVDPQLAVVRGLLHDQQQRWETGSVPVLSTRIARASYGVIVKQVYSPEMHFSEDLQDDPYEPGKKWAMNQIQWLICKGDMVDPGTPLIKPFKIRLADGEHTRSWDAEIVMSQNEKNFLPRSMKQGKSLSTYIQQDGFSLTCTAGATRICRVKSNLDGVQQGELVLKHKRGTCWSRGWKYYLCEFEIRVIVAPADLRFELWFGGQRFSGNHEPIEVKWGSAS